MAKAYHLRPSEIYGITDEIAAWSFDRAVFLFGSELQAELEEASSGAKNKGQARQRQQRVLSKWLGGKQQFKDPAAGASSSASGPVQL